MTMDDQDREFGGTSSTVISDPVDAVLERLNSKSNQTVYETIIEVYIPFCKKIYRVFNSLLLAIFGKTSTRINVTLRSFDYKNRKHI